VIKSLGKDFYKMLGSKLADEVLR
jgi:hypothetical protein